jgi:hypothetical protein
LLKKKEPWNGGIMEDWVKEDFQHSRPITATNNTTSQFIIEASHLFWTPMNLNHSSPFTKKALFRH